MAWPRPRAILGIWLGPNTSRMITNTMSSSDPPIPNTIASLVEPGPARSPAAPAGTAGPLLSQPQAAAIAAEDHGDVGHFRPPRLPDHRRTSQVLRDAVRRRRVVPTRDDERREVIGPLGILHFHDLEPAVPQS